MFLFPVPPMTEWLNGWLVEAMTRTEATLSPDVDQAEATPKRDWRRIIREVLIAIVILSVIGWWQARHLVSVGLPVPHTIVYSQNEQPEDLAASAGEQAILYVFAPWCSVCNLVSSNIRWLSAASRTPIIALGLGSDDHTRIREFWQQHDLKKTRLLIGDQETSRALKIGNFPSFYFVRNGKITTRTVGYTSFIGLLVRSWL